MGKNKTKTRYEKTNVNTKKKKTLGAHKFQVYLSLFIGMSVCLWALVSVLTMTVTNLTNVIEMPWKKVHVIVKSKSARKN